MSLIAWELYELREVVEERDGQIAQSKIVSTAWFRANVPPPLYEPDSDNRFYSLSAKTKKIFLPEGQTPAT